MVKKIKISAAAALMPFSALLILGGVFLFLEESIGLATPEEFQTFVTLCRDAGGEAKFGSPGERPDPTLCKMVPISMPLPGGGTNVIENIDLEAGVSNPSIISFWCCIQPPIGSPRISVPGGPELTFQIPIGAKAGLSLCEQTGDGKLSCPGIEGYIATLYRWLVGFAALLAVLAITWGGVQWLISRGESGKIQEAQKIIGNAIIGLVIALLSYLLMATLGQDYVTFRPLRVESIDPLRLKLEELADVPPTSSIATRAMTTTRTALPSATPIPGQFEIFKAECAKECTNRGNARGGRAMTPVVTERAGAFDCNCKETAGGAICEEPDAHVSRNANCSDVCPVGSVLPGGAYVLKVKNSSAHVDGAGKPFFCCSCITTMGGASPTCGSQKGQQCCGIPGGTVVCQEGLYPVKKSEHASENKCSCFTGLEGALCNAATGQGCAPGFTCTLIQRGVMTQIGDFITGKSKKFTREDGECKK